MNEFDNEVTLSRRRDDRRITGKAVAQSRTDAARQTQTAPVGSETEGLWDDEPNTGASTRFFTFGVSKFGGPDVLE